MAFGRNIQNTPEESSYALVFVLWPTFACYRVIVSQTSYKK